uniref:CW domain-containing protein n=1 Tax=Macrostomum lignano TaxID=282301 RepID=A0A1I8FAM0_9PLAT
MSSKLLKFLLVQAFAIADSEPIQRLKIFEWTQAGAAPRHRIYCSGLCSTKPGCFGICWVNSAKDCRLFTVSAYFNRDSWTMLTTERCDIYASIIQQFNSFHSPDAAKVEIHLEEFAAGLSMGQASKLFQGSCSHTDLTVPIWWEGQLPQQSMVASVTIYNRQDCCADRLNNFQLLVDGVVCYDMNIAIPFS